MITVIDSICGSGKTTYAINYMNEHSDKTFLYITQYKKEVERIANNTNLIAVKSINGSKAEHLENLVLSGSSISATHELFQQNGDKLKELFGNGRYTLILDEVMNVIDTIDLKPADMKCIKEKYITVDEDGKVTWVDKEYSGVWNKVKECAESGKLYLHNNTLFIWLFPVEVFKSFNGVIICTYLYDYQIQKYYYDFHGIKYKKYSVDMGKLVDYKLQKLDAGKIHILDHKINYIGDARNSLSKTWYLTKTRDRIRIMNKNIGNFRRKIAKCSLKDLYWTTFSDFQGEKLIGGKTFNASFISCNMRATNEYQDRHYVMYLINKFYNPFIKQFFMRKGIEVEEDMYALSELIQFIYRSALRKGDDIYLYVPSRRMRNLLETFLDKEVT